MIPFKNDAEAKRDIASLLEQAAKLPKEDMQGRTRLVIMAVEIEMFRSLMKHNAQHRSPHESWGILAEELDEALDEMRDNNMAKFKAEFLQCASVCLRAITDL